MLPRRLGKNTIERDAMRLRSAGAGESLPDPLVTFNIRPQATDTYDIGTSTILYRKIWASEIEALIFAQNVITIIGGWLLIGHGEGAVNEDVDTTETEIDFGDNNLAANDFVLFRNNGQVEYMQVTSQVSGNVWNVTRNLDGSGANAWPKGTPYVNLGYNGDGRIELNSNDSPRMSLIGQGATYNGQVEWLRIGDLNGDWGYSSEDFGIAIGRYLANRANLTFDSTNGIRLREHDVTKIHLQQDGDVLIGEDTSAAATTNIAIFTNAQTYNSESVSAGDVLIGDNSASKANILWNKSHGRFHIRSGTTTQLHITADGELSAGAGAVILDSDGITLDAGATSTYQVKWDSSGTQCAALYGNVVSSDHFLVATTGTPSAGNYGAIQLTAWGASGSNLESYIYINSGFTGTDGSVTIAVEQTGRIFAYPGYVRFQNDVRIDDGLYVGSDSNPVSGAIHAVERSSDPGDPPEGHWVIWMSDGTGSGDDGDIMCKIQAGSTVKTATVVDFSAV